MSGFGTQSDGRTSKVPLVIAVVVGLVLVLVVRTQVGGGGDGEGSTDSAGPRPIRTECTQVGVTASSEKAALLAQVADDYAEAGREVDGKCVQVTVTSKASGGAEQALARGWDEERDGPLPTVWSPASSSWLVLLRQERSAQDLPPLAPETDAPSIARTPLVLAMPRPMAEALGWPDTPLGWGDLLALGQDPAGWGKFGHPEWGRFKLGKTNPDFSTSGLNATIGAYFAATGLASDLTEADLAKPATVDYVRKVESSVVHYGDTTLTFLGNLQAADDRGQGLTYISAVAVEEKSVWDYNQGNPSGDPKTLGEHPKPKTPLVAIYPKEGTLFSDNPYIVLDGADWVDEAQVAGAEDFLAFVQTKEAQAAFLDAAFRDFEGTAGPRTVPEQGMLPAQPTAVLTPPAPPVLAAVKDSFEQLRKRARVLLVLDVSGSMGADVGSAGRTKLELAQSAASTALDAFAPDDEVGLWVFSSDAGGSPRDPYLELVPIQPVAQGLAVLREKLANLVPGGGTALYATTRDAQAAMRKAFEADRINAVVLLTDGVNDYPPDSDLDGLVGGLQSESDDTTVRVFPIAYGDDADLEVLRQIAQAARGAVYDASDPASIDKVFAAVISNF